jgi:hypothetical protein
MSRILKQLVHSGLLFDEDTVAAIIAGDARAMENVVTDLVIGVMDAETIVRNDSMSTLTEKRIARQGLAVAFLAAIAWMKEAS